MLFFFVVVFGCFLGLHNVEVYVGGVFGKQNVFFFLYDAYVISSSQTRKEFSFDSTGNLRYKNVGGRFVCIIYISCIPLGQRPLK